MARLGESYPLTIPLEDDLCLGDNDPVALDHGLPFAAKASRKSLSLAMSGDWQDIQQQCEALNSANMQISSLTLSFPDMGDEDSQPLYSIRARPAPPLPWSPGPNESSLAHSFLAATPRQREQGCKQVDIKLGRGTLFSPRLGMSPSLRNTPSQASPDHAITRRHMAQRSQQGARFLHRVGTEPKNVGSSRVTKASPEARLPPHSLKAAGFPDLCAGKHTSAPWEADCQSSGDPLCSRAGNDMTPILTGSPTRRRFPHSVSQQADPFTSRPLLKQTVGEPACLNRYSSSSLVSVSSMDSSATEQSFAPMPFSPKTPCSIEDGGSLYSGLYPQGSLEKAFHVPPRVFSTSKSSSFKEHVSRAESNEGAEGFLYLPGCLKPRGSSRLSMEVAEKLRLQVNVRPFDARRNAPPNAPLQHGSPGFASGPMPCSADIEGDGYPVPALEPLRRVNAVAQGRCCWRESEARLLCHVEDESVKLLHMAGDPVVRPFGRAGDPIVRRRGMSD